MATKEEVADYINDNYESIWSAEELKGGWIWPPNEEG